LLIELGNNDLIGKEVIRMWTLYSVELQFNDRFAASTPKNPEDIEIILGVRAPSQNSIERREKKGKNVTPLPELAEQVKEEVQAKEEVERGYATFKRDDNGLYYEARCVRAHLKDCANVIAGQLGIKGLKRRLADRVYVEPEKLYIDRKEPDGSETRIVHAMTPRGPRSSFKTFDYAERPRLGFTLKVLNDGVITKKILEKVFQYGEIHGMGQERGQDMGKYKVIKFEKVSRPARA